MIPSIVFQRASNGQTPGNLTRDRAKIKVILSATDTKSASQKNQSNGLKVFVAWTDDSKSYPMWEALSSLAEVERVASC